MIKNWVIDLIKNQKLSHEQTSSVLKQRYPGVLRCFHNSLLEDFVIKGVNTCTQTVIRFFTAKYKILQLHSKDHSFFYNEIQNFESSTQTAIRITHKEIRNLTIYHQFSFVS